MLAYTIQRKWMFKLTSKVFEIVFINENILYTRKIAKRSQISFNGLILKTTSIIIWSYIKYTRIKQISMLKIFATENWDRQWNIKEIWPQH